MTRLIDRISLRSTKPVPLEQLRTANAAPQVLEDQRRAHVIALASYLADVGADPDMRNIRASERREVAKRTRVIDALAAATTSTTTLSQARLRLTQKD